MMNGSFLLVALLILPWAASAPGQSAPPPYVWRNVVIGGGGFVTGLVTHPRAKDLVYARTDVGGAYRWDAGAQRWIPITDSFGGMDFTGIESLAIDPADTNRVYLAAGIYHHLRAAIFRSDNQGRTWRRADIPAGMGGNEIGRFNGERLAVDPHDGGILFFGSRRDGLWKSGDAGVTWNPVPGFPQIDTAPPTAGGAGSAGRPWPNFTPQQAGVICVLFDPASGLAGKATPVVYAAVSTAGTNFFRSQDGGATWRAVPGQPLGLRPNHVVEAGDGFLYLSYGQEPGPGTMDDGAVWKFDPGREAWTDITPVKPAAGGQPFGYGAVTVDAQHPQTILAATFCHWQPQDEIFRSTNGGGNWAPLLRAAHWDHSSAPYTKAIKPHWLGSMVISPFDSNWALFTTGYGIWACTNLMAADAGRATSWVFLDAGLEETVPLALASPPEGAHLLSGLGDIDGFRHDNLEAAPERGAFAGPRLGNTESIAFAARNPRMFVRAGTGGRGVRAAISFDGGSNWQALANEPAPGATGGAVAISSDGRTIVWTADRELPYYTTDWGGTWNLCAGLPPGVRVVADTVNPSRFYAFDPSAGTLLASTNGAAYFMAADLNAQPGSGERTGFGSGNPARFELSATPGAEGNLWLARGRNGLWHSADGGAAFAQIDNIRDAVAVGFGKSADRNSPELFLYGTIGAEQGIFRSDDGGKDWARINDDNHQFGWITRIAGDPRVFGRVYLATSGRGIIYGEPASVSNSFGANDHLKMADFGN